MLEDWYADNPPVLTRIRPALEISPENYLLILISIVKDSKKLLAIYKRKGLQTERIELRIQKYLETIESRLETIEFAETEYSLADLDLSLDKLEKHLQDLNSKLEDLRPSDLHDIYSVDELRQGIQFYRKQEYHLRAAMALQVEQVNYTKLKFLLTHFQQKLLTKLSTQDQLKKDKVINGQDPKDVDKVIYHFRGQLAYL